MSFCVLGRSVVHLCHENSPRDVLWSEEDQAWTCTCNVRVQLGMLCRHLIACRKVDGLNPFDARFFHPRWVRQVAVLIVPRSSDESSSSDQESRAVNSPGGSDDDDIPRSPRNGDGFGDDDSDRMDTSNHASQQPAQTEPRSALSGQPRPKTIK